MEEGQNFNMVSVFSQPGKAALEMRQEMPKSIPSKPLVKETQREENVMGNPQSSKKESRMPTKAQDVAELKDYVGGHKMDNSPLEITI